MGADRLKVHKISARFALRDCNTQICRLHLYILFLSYWMRIVSRLPSYLGRLLRTANIFAVPQAYGASSV